MTLDAQIVNYTEAKELVNAGAQLVDVRTIEEFNDTFVGGVNLPLDELLDTYTNVLNEDKELPIVLFCRSGVRSQKAATFLKGLGYKNLYDVQSYLNWLG